MTPGRIAWLFSFLVAALLMPSTAPDMGLAQAGESHVPSASPVRGVAGDWWADLIVGHPDFISARKADRAEYEDYEAAKSAKSAPPRSR